MGGNAAKNATRTEVVRPNVTRSSGRWRGDLKPSASRDQSSPFVVENIAGVAATAALLGVKS
jgi:hypothetical protein